MPHHAFTIEYPKKQKAIITSCKISAPLGPSMAPYTGNALWDTGATSTVINTKVSKYLSLVSIGKMVARGINSKSALNHYIVTIELPNGVIANNLGVLETNLGDNIDVLVGMDIIGQGDFSICNAKVFSFALPTLGKSINFF